MLKIKDGLDLKELEKFGFVKSTQDFITFQKNYLPKENHFLLDIETKSLIYETEFSVVVCLGREVSFEGNFFNGYIEDFYNETIFDLIKADIVEKV